jgi:hypothetical protein
VKSVCAERLIYTRVETAYSPRRFSGFQTVWKSKSLTAADTAAVEKCVRCFRPNAGARRLQFFAIPSGKLALSHTAQIEAHPEIVDRNGRGGAFLVHCFLLSREAMALLENDPFRFFAAAVPLEGIERLVEDLGPGTGIAPPIEIVPVASRPELSEWTAQEVVRLLSVALRADNLREQSRTVPVTGEIGQIEQALRVALSLTPTAKRLACTFTTWAEGCPLERGVFWASGLSRRPSSDRLEINARDRRVSLASVHRGTEDLYESWIEEACSHTSLEKVAAQAESVDWFLRAIEGTPVEGVVPLKPEALTSFLHLHRHSIAERFQALFGRYVRRPLAKELAYHLLREVERPEFPSLVEAAIASSSQIPALARLAADWIEPTASIDEDLRQDLQNLARKGNNALLLFWASTLGRKVDVKGRDEALGKMSSPEFNRSLSKLLHPVDPVHFVEIRHLSPLLRNERLDTAREDLLIELIERIVDVQGGSHLALLNRCVYRIGDPGLERLARKIRKQEVAEGFRREIEAAAPKPTNLFRRLLP